VAVCREHLDAATDGSGLRDVRALPPIITTQQVQRAAVLRDDGSSRLRRRWPGYPRVSYSENLRAVRDAADSSVLSLVAPGPLRWVHIRMVGSTGDEDKFNVLDVALPKDGADAPAFHRYSMAVAHATHADLPDFGLSTSAAHCTPQSKYIYPVLLVTTVAEVRAAGAGATWELAGTKTRAGTTVSLAGLDTHAAVLGGDDGDWVVAAASSFAEGAPKWNDQSERFVVPPEDIILQRGDESMRRALRAGVPLWTLERGVRMSDKEVDDGFTECHHPSEVAAHELWDLVVHSAVLELDAIATDRHPEQTLLELAHRANKLPPYNRKGLSTLFDDIKAIPIEPEQDMPISVEDLNAHWFVLKGSGKPVLMHVSNSMFRAGNVRDLRDRCNLRMREKSLGAVKKFVQTAAPVRRETTHYIFARTTERPARVLDLSSANAPTGLVNLHLTNRDPARGPRLIESDVSLVHWTRFVPHPEYGGRWGRAHTYSTWDDAVEAVQRWSKKTLPLLAVRGGVAIRRSAGNRFHAIKVRNIAPSASVGRATDATVDVCCPLFMMREQAGAGVAPLLDWSVTPADLEAARITLQAG